jgi:predicted ATPase
VQEARRREAAIRSLIEAGPARHAPADVVAKEYETAWRNLNGRPIKNLIDLALMTDPELQAAMQVLSTLLGPAHFTDSNCIARTYAAW